MQGAGNVLRAADQLRRGSASAATELLGLGLRDPQASAARLDEAVGAGRFTTDTASAGFRSPYLFDGTSLVMLDQREPLGSGATVECRAPSEVATAIAAGVAGGGPVLAQIAAYGLVLALAQATDRLRPARRAALAAAANTLRQARPHARAVGWAVERMTQRWQLAIDLDAPAALAELRAEADQIAMQSATDHARLGRHGADELTRTGQESLDVLMHGDMGPLAGGLVGTGFAVVQSVVSVGREVHVWLTEAAPTGEGTRLAAPQLAQADIPHTVVPDSAVAWLLDGRPLDAVLLRADLVCANGDTAAPLGALNVARLAQAAGVPVYACAPTLVVDAGLADGAAIQRSDRLPKFDVVPAGLFGGFMTEHGVVKPPFSNA